MFSNRLGAGNIALHAWSFACLGPGVWWGIYYGKKCNRHSRWRDNLVFRILCAFCFSAEWSFCRTLILNLFSPNCYTIFFHFFIRLSLVGIPHIYWLWRKVDICYFLLVILLWECWILKLVKPLQLKWEQAKSVCMWKN